MTSKDLFSHIPEADLEKVRGKIYHLGDGFAFIESKTLPYTRIYLHWQYLVPDTLHFSEIKFGMEVEFKAFNHPVHGWRAMNCRVIEND